MALRAAARYRAVTAVAASVTDAGVPVLLSNVTVEHAVEFVLELFADACGTDQAAQNLCVVPVPNASSGALQPIFRADLASVLGVSEDRVLLRATGTEAPSPLEVLVRIEPSSPGPIDHLGDGGGGDVATTTVAQVVDRPRRGRLDPHQNLQWGRGFCPRGPQQHSVFRHAQD